ncbi:hypothetical protein [Sphingobacterium sp. SGL-16]|uniref:hypothetical protein n=1 Tax=Sphingobacterium sp. SGL-16 TaxID=2710883 RepID=UPI0013ED5A57|nr:hypothetical protein [Sphingobacterium sp. SGL-16]NGM74858.1 hypothetical protein [Sphingobacterium sp. SGL-16]
MKYLSIICLVSLLIGCSKQENKIQKDSEFLSRVFKDNNFWNAKSANGFYHSPDSMQFIVAYGENNERLTIAFKKDIERMGIQDFYSAKLIESNCEHCASIKNAYSIDSTKINSFELMSYTTSTEPNRVGIRFSLNFKKDSLYTDHKPMQLLFDGILEVPIKNE